MMILKKGAIGKLRLRKPLHFYVFADESEVTLVSTIDSKLRASGKTLKEALVRLDLMLLMLLYLYETPATQTELFVATHLLMGNAENWGDLRVPSP